MKFIKIDAIIGRQDDKDISQEGMDEFVDSFIEWLEQHGYETCAVWELMGDETEEGKIDAQTEVSQNYECPSVDEWMNIQARSGFKIFGERW